MNISFEPTIWEDLCTAMMMADHGYNPQFTDEVIFCLKKSWDELDNSEQAMRFIGHLIERHAPKPSMSLAEFFKGEDAGHNA